MSFVLDASVAMLWLVPETNLAGVDYAAVTLKALKESQAVVPSLFALEAANVVAKVELKGVVTEDFPLIKRSAEGLEKMSRQAEWEVFHLDEYNHFSAEFRRIARSMAKQAEQKNIDGAALAYVQLTMSCVECHKFTRGVRMADAIP